MKRESRQHGTIRIRYPLLSSPPTRNRNESTKVSTKPTNQSCKSNVKSRRTQKIRSSVADFRLVTRRVLDSGPGLKFSGFSATGILDYLGSEDYYMDHDYEDDYDYDYDDGVDDVEESYDEEILDSTVEIEEIDDCEAGDYELNDVDNDDEMSFYEVGFVWKEMEEDESWCLVEEL